LATLVAWLNFGKHVPIGTLGFFVCELRIVLAEGKHVYLLLLEANGFWLSQRDVTHHEQVTCDYAELAQEPR